ncbi:MAG TPA: hypothetical protein DCZ72_04065 [Armatimonadetes bacterium]|nr:hypothetical protein [Armatimonadota bacterium]
MSQRWERWWAAAPPLLRFDLRRSARLARGRRGRWQLALALLVFGAAYAGGLRSLSPSLGGREGGDLLALLTWLVATWCVVGLAALNASLLTADREQGRFDELAVIPQSDAAWLWGRLATPALSGVALVVLSAGPIVLGACLRPNDGPPLGAGLAIVFGSAAAGLALGLLATLHARSAATARVVAPLLALGWLCVPYVLAGYAWSAGGGGYLPQGSSTPASSTSRPPGRWPRCWSCCPRRCCMPGSMSPASGATAPRRAIAPAGKPRGVHCAITRSTTASAAACSSGPFGAGSTGRTRS